MSRALRCSAGVARIVTSPMRISSPTSISADIRRNLGMIPAAGWGSKVGPGHLDPLRAGEALPVLKPRFGHPNPLGSLSPLGRGRRGIRPKRSAGTRLASLPRWRSGSSSQAPGLTLCAPNIRRASAEGVAAPHHGVAREPPGGGRPAAEDGGTRRCHARVDGRVRGDWRHVPGSFSSASSSRSCCEFPVRLVIAQDGAVTRAGGDRDRARRRGRGQPVLGLLFLVRIVGLSTELRPGPAVRSKAVGARFLRFLGDTGAAENVQ